MSVALPPQPKERTTLYPDPDISKSLEKLQISFATLVTRMFSRLEDHIENKKIKLKDVARFFEEYVSKMQNQFMTCLITFEATMIFSIVQS